MEIDMTKKVKVQAKTLHIHLKVCDCFGGKITDQDGETLVDKEDGYVPGFMPGDHYGDYVILDIDLDTGMVINWVKPKPEQIQEFIESEE